RPSATPAHRAGEIATAAEAWGGTPMRGRRDTVFPRFVPRMVQRECNGIWQYARWSFAGLQPRLAELKSLRVRPQGSGRLGAEYRLPRHGTMPMPMPRPSPRRALRGWGLLAVLDAALACGRGRPSTVGPPVGPSGRRDTSNVLRSDYVGSAR